MPNNEETILSPKETLPEETSLDYIEEIPVVEIPNYLQGVLVNGKVAASVVDGKLQGVTMEIGSENSIFKADSNGIYLGNATFDSAPFRVSMAGALTLGVLGYIKGGQTAYNTGTGFFLGYSTDAYKFSIGNPAGNYLTWDNSVLTIKGNVNREDIHWLTYFESKDGFDAVIDNDGYVTV